MPNHPPRPRETMLVGLGWAGMGGLARRPLSTHRANREHLGYTVNIEHLSVPTHPLHSPPETMLHS